MLETDRSEGGGELVDEGLWADWTRVGVLTELSMGEGGVGTMVSLSRRGGGLGGGGGVDDGERWAGWARLDTGCPISFLSH